MLHGGLPDSNKQQDPLGEQQLQQSLPMALQTAVALMRDNIETPLSIETLCQHASFSRRLRLFQRIKVLCGLPIEVRTPPNRRPRQRSAQPPFAQRSVELKQKSQLKTATSLAKLLNAALPLPIWRFYLLFVSSRT
ncbi:hypothetical protein [Ruegeria arenilitoris]|uniref:hypothetical protein n=1 Tax=Ruegeria arenilitoris TaxID=1173585 RepID=UPI00147E8D62|nr:hypothetical protein [Ruegeria arenilitoris]